jgi:D-alanyl-D-alanine carboxypeptidase
VTVTDYEQRIQTVLAALNIPASHPADRGVPLCVEATELVSIGEDMLGRERYLTPAAAVGWLEMQAAAILEDVEILLVSAFRSVDYQRAIFERKLAAGQSLEEILRVNLPPGYSEHHTGLAIDVATPGTPPLTEAFEQTAAFEWLANNASRFGFALSYPRDNPYGVIYEPWHWARTTSPLD